MNYQKEFPRTMGPKIWGHNDFVSFGVYFYWAIESDDVIFWLAIKSNAVHLLVD